MNVPFAYAVLRSRRSIPDPILTRKHYILRRFSVSMLIAGEALSGREIQLEIFDHPDIARYRPAPQGH